MEGGAGNDTAQDNGGAGDEHFIVTGAGPARHRDARQRSRRSSSTSARPRRSTSTRNGGDDSVEVNGGLGALIKVDANLGDGNDTIKAAQRPPWT